MTLLRINNRMLKRNGTLLTGAGGEPPAPGLPPYTIRLKYRDGVTPTFSKGTAVQVSSSPNIWDLTYENPDWYELVTNQTDLLEVIDGNTSGVTSMGNMFKGCGALTTVSLFDTSSVTYMGYMFYQCNPIISVPLFDTRNVTRMAFMFAGCISLTSVPLFNTSRVTDMDRMFGSCKALTAVPLFDTSRVTRMDYMFYKCNNVQSGALALYRQASSQATPPSKHTNTFTNCGANTTTGRAELDQIPQDWGGNALPDDLPVD